MANINKIKLSGTTYNIQDLSAAKSVELTQSQYDALVSGGTVDPNTFYIITDAQGADLSQYYTSAQTESAITQAVSGKVDTTTFNTYSGSVDTALSGKQDTLSAGTGIEISGNVISATGGGGGGKAIEAGRGISVTTGETADTVSFNLPRSAGTGEDSIIVGYEGNVSNSRHSYAEGMYTKAKGWEAHAEGYYTEANSSFSHAEGQSTKANGSASHSEGRNTIAMNYYSHAEGYGTLASNEAEHASGKYNVSHTGSTDADNTLFSIGNGTADNARHNAFEIRQNGDIYITSGNTDIKLQDNLGGGSVDQTVISGSTNAVSGGAVYSQLGGMKIVKLTESEYTALVTKDSNTLYCVVPDPSN